MRYKRFGKTNLELSVFSLGTMRCLANAIDAQETIATALELGINHIETARGYGQAEDYVGLALQGTLAKSREDLYITTKLPPTPNSQEMEHWINESLQRLSVNYIDCLAIHGINTWEHFAWVTEEGGCFSAVQDAIAQGKINHVGFSTHAPLEVILATLETDWFEFVNLHYYYFFQRNLEAIERAFEKDMGIFIISPADKGGRLYSPPEKLQELCFPLSPLEFNYRFLLSDSRITTLSVGAANAQELQEPLKWADADTAWTPLESEILERLEAEEKESLGDTHCSQCYQCLPCPEQINIPEVLRLRNLAVAYNMTDFGQYRYRMFENAGHWFPGKKGNKCTDCGDCLPRCPEKLDIPTLLRDTHERLNGSPRRRLWE